MNKPSNNKKRFPQTKTAWLFMLPFLVIFFLFTILPVVISMVLGFTNFNLLEMPRFVGFQNYIQLFLNDEIFLKAIKNTLFFAIITGPVGYILCFTFAWFIHQIPPVPRSLLTLLFYAPSIAGSMYVIWTYIFSNDTYGLMNSVLISLGLVADPIQWLTDASYMPAVVVTVVLWQSLGAGFLSFIAGLQNIDRTLYEAAAVDGISNRWQELYFITFPSMRPQLMFGAVMTITSSFGIGAVISALVGFPSTDYAVHTIVHHLEDYGNVRFEMGYACAIATLLFLLMVGANKMVQKLLSKVGK